MKTRRLFFLLVIFVTLAFALNTLAQDYTQWALPEGAKARLGKGFNTQIAYSADGARLAVAGSIGIWIYDAKIIKELDLLAGYSDWVVSVAFNPDGRTLASGSYDNTIRLWDANIGKHLHTLTGHTDVVLSVAFSPDGQTLASGGDDETVRLWDATTGRYLHTLTAHTDQVNSVAFSPDGNTLASGSDDGTVLLWELAPTSPEPKKLAANVNSDGIVNIIDLTLVASNFGKTGQNDADVNGDGIVKQVR